MMIGRNSTSILGLNNIYLNPRILAPILIVSALGLLSGCGGEVRLLPTKTPVIEKKIIRDIAPQSQSLMLRLTSPQVNVITDAQHATVAGTASPDATLSVNGQLVIPDIEGGFSTELEISAANNPMIIEVIASSTNGETETMVHPVVFLDGPNDSRRDGYSNKAALFGTVTAITPSGFTVDTKDGPVTLTADNRTSVDIHGWDIPSHTDLTEGSAVVVLTDGQNASSIRAILTRPALTRHFTGMVIESPLNRFTGMPSLTLQDGSGRQVSATIKDDLAGGLTVSDLPGTVVTAILEQDTATGILRVTGVDSALDAADRINEALMLNQSIATPEATLNVSALRWRLAEHGVRNISMLITGQSFAGSEEALAQAENTYTKIFSQHHIGAPAAEVTGLVTAIAQSMGTNDTRLVTIQPDLGQPVKVKISGSTPVSIYGERIKSRQLDLASRVTVRYGISGNNATRLTVIAGNTLSDKSSTQLATMSGRGEILGTVAKVSPLAAISTIIDRDSGTSVSLQSSGVSIHEDGHMVELTPSIVGATVIARFDPSSYRLLDLESLSVRRNEYTVSGVIHSFIPKVAKGNITLRNSDGQLQSFSHDASTLIRRNGLNGSIHDIRLGDLVRPNTRVTASPAAVGEPPKIIFLSLKAPEPGQVTGFIRGVSLGYNGELRITISNIWLDLICLTVNSKTTINQQGKIIDALNLAVGQRVTGAFDPVTLEAVILAIEPVEITKQVSAAGDIS